MRRNVIIAASVVVSAVFLWLALRDVPLAQVWENITQADPVWIMVSLLFGFACLYTRAIRWRRLVGGAMTTRRAYLILGVNFMLNQLPLRAGEVARGLLATRSGIPFVTAVTSIVVERMLDTLLVVVMVSVALSLAPNTVPAAQQAALLFGVVAVVAFVVLVALARYPKIAHGLLDWAERTLPLVKRIGARRLFDNVLDGLHPLTQWQSGAHAVVWTLISWALSLCVFYALERALNIAGIDLWLMAALGVSLASFSIAIPVSIAALGPFQSAVRLAGEAVAMPITLATSLGFLFHGISIFTYVVLGVIGLLALGVSLSDVTQTPPAAEPADDRAEIVSQPDAL